MRALPAVPQLQRGRADPFVGQREAVAMGVDVVGDDVVGDDRGVTRASLTRGAAALAITVATVALLVATGPRLAIVWDEGYTLGREARLRSWFQALADPPRWFLALPFLAW